MQGDGMPNFNAAAEIRVGRKSVNNFRRKAPLESWFVLAPLKRASIKPDLVLQNCNRKPDKF